MQSGKAHQPINVALSGFVALNWALNVEVNPHHKGDSLKHSQINNVSMESSRVFTISYVNLGNCAI